MSTLRRLLVLLAALWLVAPSAQAAEQDWGAVDTRARVVAWSGVGAAAGSIGLALAGNQNPPLLGLAGALAVASTPMIAGGGLRSATSLAERSARPGRVLAGTAWWLWGTSVGLAGLTALAVEVGTFESGGPGLLLLVMAFPIGGAMIASWVFGILQMTSNAVARSEVDEMAWRPGQVVLGLAPVGLRDGGGLALNGRF